MNVVFWSPLPGVSRVSSTALAVSLSTAIRYRTRCSLLQLQYKGNLLQKYLVESGNLTEANYLQSMGIDPFIRAVRSGELDEDAVFNYTLSFVNQHFNYFPETYAGDERTFKNDLQNSADELFAALGSGVLVNFIDAPADSNFYSKMAIAYADLVVVCLPQSKHAIDAFFQDFDLPKEKCFFLFTGFNPARRLKVFNISQQHKQISSKNSGVIPDCAGYGDALDLHHTISYFYNNVKCKSKDPNYKFISEVNASTGKLLKLCGVSVER